MSDFNNGALPAASPESPQIHRVQIVEEKRKNGLGVASLVVGIVAAAFSLIPLVGMVAFFLGPVAIILGLIAVFLKNRKKGTAIAGIVLGVVSLIIAGIVTAVVGAAVQAVDKSINAEHTVEYVVTTSGPATLSYWTPGGSSQEDITADWRKSITSKEFNITSLSVTGSYSDPSAAVSCEILIDGKSAGKNTGSGTGAHALCSGSTWAK
ncbi:DUF4190 domain-containing protein [Arthrobacter cavernae]|uniref:DUF4190 domain-containing protein n=1 Tax=Arthrobacter cavernae TaxID=2817681 RepID=A0A939KHJ4_9MICC|nr:DUF4190 domain-containing protein [Arthrobacter cavernae]MBO1266637.1 DUF4190 domain-containing protein [Arthrobacter cavernae]